MYASKADGLNLGGLLAVEFLAMQFVELYRWQDIRKPGSVNMDPVFKGNSVPTLQPGCATAAERLRARAVSRCVRAPGG